MTKNVSFGRKMVWLNKVDCQQLLPQLKQLLFYQFAKYTFSTFGITTKFCHVLEMNINVEMELNKSSRKKTICSGEYKHKINKKDEIILHCRCFKQFSKIKKDDMFNGYLGIKSLPKSISMLKIYGGLSIPQIPFEKWNYFYLSHKRLNNGGALFSMKKLKNIHTLKVKICFQVWSIIDHNGQPIKV